MAVPLTEGMHFVTARKRIRAALVEDGAAGQIEALVARLLGPVRQGPRVTRAAARLHRRRVPRQRDTRLEGHAHG